MCKAMPDIATHDYKVRSQDRYAAEGVYGVQRCARADVDKGYEHDEDDGDYNGVEWDIQDIQPLDRRSLCKPAGAREAAITREGPNFPRCAGTLAYRGGHLLDDQHGCHYAGPGVVVVGCLEEDLDEWEAGGGAEDSAEVADGGEVDAA